jgi:hypothetical protein
VDLDPDANPGFESGCEAWIQVNSNPGSDPAKIKFFLENVEIFHNDLDLNPDWNPNPK